MFKFALLALLCLSVFALDVSKYEHTDVTEEDIEELFALYLLHEAPFHVEPTVERYQYFKSEVLAIIAHNRDPTQTWRQTITKYTAFTLKELEGVAIMAPQNCSATNTISRALQDDTPAFFDWRECGVVTPVKNQGACGSCWSFSTTGALEANWAIYTNSSPPSLSEQQLVDCAGGFNNFGCSGGLPSQAFEYIFYAGGIEDESDYPYTAKDGTCYYDSSKDIAHVPFGSANITSGDEDGILDAVYNVGPVSIAFQVASDFRNYDGGVYSSSICKSTAQDVNHAVLAVGWGTDEAGMDYWIVKNSWGTTWGEEGYFRIERGVNMCGLAVCASYPNLRGSE